MNRAMPRYERSRCGTVLFIVLVAVVMLALSAYTFTALMQTEEEAARLMTRRVQSKYLVDSGVDYIRLLLSYDDATIREKGGIWDNPGLFQAIPVAVDPALTELLGRFSVITSSMDEEGTPEGYRFGLMDESSRLNLNVLPYMDQWVDGGAHQLLMGLPYMTEEIADAIIDFIDADDDEREFGAESAYYTGQNPGYECKNGPLDSLDQLLLIRGVTPQLLFGADTNRNGIIDAKEQTGSTALGSDMELGWANYISLFSKESNLNANGFERINLNNPDLEQLYDDLRSVFNEEWSQFIIMYRVNGPYKLTEDEEPPTQNPFLGELDFEALGDPKFTFSQILDLVDTYTTAADPKDSESTVTLRSPVNIVSLLTAMQNVTTFDGDTIPGRINIMQAPRRVLEGIPGLTPEIIDTIILRREFELDDPDGSDLNRQYETWLWTEGIVDLTTMRLILPFVCTGGDVYRADVVGYFDDGVVASRAEVTLDTTVPIPRILFWRDKSNVSAAYDIDVLGRDLVQ